MNFLSALLTDFFHYAQEPMFIVISLIFVAIFMAVFGLLLLWNDFFNPVRSRFKKNITPPTKTDLSVNNLVGQLKYSNLFVPANEGLLQRTATRINYAGFHEKNTLLNYYALRMLLMILLPILVFLITSIIPSINGDMVFKSTVVALGLGYMLPSLILDRLITKRQKILRRAFPDALDLLVVCSEAGLSLDAAIQKVGVEMSFSQSELADELNIVIAEIRAGIDRHTALERLVTRTGVEDIRGLVSSLSQSMRFGTSIVETLKVYSEDLRDKRSQAAEAMAAKISTKLLFPLACCLLPALLLVILGPAVMIFKTM